MMSFVFSGENLAGTLRRAPGTSLTEFTYDPEYIANGGFPLAPELPFRKQPISSSGLHPFFCNLISEGLREKIQQQAISSTGVRPNITRYDLLVFFGADCFGAISVIPEFQIEPDKAVALESLSKDPIFKLYAHIPGYQPKYLAVKNGKGGFRGTARGEVSTHIAKLSMPEKEKIFGIIENEYVTNRLMAVLLPSDRVVDAEIADFGDEGVNALIVKRFDRAERSEGLQRLRFLEFNQLLGRQSEDRYKGHYGEMAQYIREHSQNKQDRIATNIEDVKKLYLRILASFVLGVTDNHFKNYGLIEQDGEMRLSPNYDLVSSVLIKKPGTQGTDFSTLALNIGMEHGRNTESNMKLGQLRPKHIIALGRDFGLTNDEILEACYQIRKGIDNIESFPEFGDKTLDRLREVLINHANRRWRASFAGVSSIMNFRAAKNDITGPTSGAAHPISTGRFSDHPPPAR